MNFMLTQGCDDYELFRIVAGMETMQLALDSEGNWLVPARIALDLANSRIEQEKSRRSISTNWAIALAVLVVLGLFFRYV